MPAPAPAPPPATGRGARRGTRTPAALLRLALAATLAGSLPGCAVPGRDGGSGPGEASEVSEAGEVGEVGGAAPDPAARLVARRAAVRGLLRDLGGAVRERDDPGRAELRGSYRGCRSDALTQGYRSWTYAGGGRVPADAGLAEVVRLLHRVGASRVVRRGEEVRARRDGVLVAVVRTRGAVVLSARAEPCVDVPDDQQEAWFDREPHPAIRLGARPRD